MTISLDSTLQAAQDGDSHRMIIDINSKPMVPDIPFVGQLLTDETTNEQMPNCITHSSNRVVLVYSFGTGQFKFVFTDTDRTTFNFVTLGAADLGYTPVTETVIEATLCELSDTNIGMVFTTETSNEFRLRYAKLSVSGGVISYGLISTYSKADHHSLKSPFVIRLQDGSYFLTYLKGYEISPISSGTYTGDTNSEFEVQITQDGTQSTAKFVWRKDGGAWSTETTCTGGTPQLLSDGVYINFAAGNYYEGMTFKITCTAATKAVGYITILQNVANDDQVVIGTRTYTYKLQLVGGGNPNEVAIDIYAKEISLENLRCAITDTTYQGTGEGVRYGNGTTAHPDVTAERSQFTLMIEALVPGAAGNSISISVPGGKMIAAAMSGGNDSAIGEVRTSESSLIMRRTSSDFSSWGGESEIRPGTVVANRKDHVSLEQLQNGDIWITFDNYDDWSWSNLYYSVSSDNGVSWGNAIALTSYDSAQAKGLHPMMVQRSLTEVWLVYHEESGALHISDESPGWPGGSCSIGDIHIYNGKIYAVSTWPLSGNKIFEAVIEIDITTWRITRSWTTTSNPGFHTCFGSEHVWYMSSRSSGKYVVIATLYYCAVGVLDVDANTIRHYFFFQWDKYAIAKNVNWQQPDDTDVLHWFFCQAVTDEINDKLHLALTYTFWYPDYILTILGIDLTDQYVPGSEWNITTNYYNDEDFTGTLLQGVKDGDMRLHPDQDTAILTSCQSVSTWKGFLMVFNSSGDSWGESNYFEGDNPMSSIPFTGIRKAIYHNGIVYGSFWYESMFQPDKKGVCRIDLNSGAVSYLEPVWPVQHDDYQLVDFALTDDGMLVITSEEYGITIYDIAANTWTLYDNDSVLGLTPDGYSIFGPVTYDPSSGLIIAGVPRSIDNPFHGVVAFNRYGMLKQPKYKTGTYTTVWTFGSENQFIVGILDYEACVCLDPLDQGLYAFWTSQNITQNELSIKWAKESPDFNLTPYIVKDTPVVINTSTQTDKPNKISFAVSHGHLFDPFNDLSLWRNYVAKGHKLVVRIGEKINDIDYWQDQGSFLITERSMITYERGKYPVMEIKGEDKRNNWAEGKTEVTDYYENSPENILADILENEVGEPLPYIDIPVFDNSITLYHQWIDKTPMEIIKQICDRFGYFGKITVDDKFTCGKISANNPIDHNYTDKKAMITYTSDDTFSDYTTKVVVKCEGRSFEEVISPRERIMFINGTIGWWGQRKETQHWYSENKEKRVKNPELKVLETTSGIMFELAGRVREYIVDEDPDNRYIIVKIDAPDLRPALAACIAAYASSSKWSGTFWGEAGKTAALITALSILGSIVNYQFEIWGNPVGEVRRSWQAEKEDEEFRAIVGKDNVKTLNEPLAYYINDCQAVANHEMFVIEAQRKRIKFTKIGHLQDETGDTITVIHPYTGRTKKIFVTDITRTLKIAETSEGSGHFIDDIEGWMLA